MFAFIKGSLESKAKNYVVIENSGIGYKIFMSEVTIEKLGELGEIVKVHTYYLVRENEISLYGFTSQEELRLFELLLSVSGVGAKSAIAMLSAIEPSAFALAVITNDVGKLTKVPGVGNKTAQRLILELKDKLKTEDSISAENIQVKSGIKNNKEIEEAMEALKVLGYTGKEIEKALQNIELEGLSIEKIIKIALGNLAR
ncbi:MAG: Holliday junction branch migration protein RuvA [Clostridia bacterium]|nr:Holliday junction branch migration protein RuvA [Clostridia bacterium]